MQSEYSLWTRNPEIAVLDACRELNVAFVAFSPLARGFLTGDIRDPAQLPPKDIRLAMPRFQAPHFGNNLKLLNGFAQIARENDCTMAQLSLAWLLAKRRTSFPFPQPRGWTIWRITPLRPMCGCAPTRWRKWKRWSIRTRCPDRATMRLSSRNRYGR
jgi:hypothetical protein